MKPRIAFKCRRCSEFAEVDITGGHFSCPACGQHAGKAEITEKIFDACPLCGCKQFYLSKNFNQFTGCLIMFCGIVLVPVTYGLSLPVFALIDWLLYKRVPTIANCYKCGCEFHNFPQAKRFKPFMHHIGLKYDKYR